MGQVGGLEVLVEVHACDMHAKPERVIEVQKLDINLSFKYQRLRRNL